jgi:cellobiose-specific phosphotransferase system component IIC
VVLLVIRREVRLPFVLPPALSIFMVDLDIVGVLLELLVFGVDFLKSL